MSRIFAMLIFVCLVAVPEAWARPKIQGFCVSGAPSVTIPGTQGRGSQRMLQSYPSCTIRLYYPGTTTLVPSNNVYSNETGTVKGNPFTAAGNSMWFAFLDEPDVDVNFSGGGISAPFTMSHYISSPTAHLTGFGARCNGTTNDFTAMNTASLAFATAGGGNLVIPAAKTCVVGTSLNSAASMKLVFEAGAKLMLATGATLTIPSPDNIQSPRQQIFDWTGRTGTTNWLTYGKVVFSSAGKGTRRFYPEWWGALNDGVEAYGTAGVHAGSLALPSDGAVFHFAVGTYMLGHSCVDTDSDPDSLREAVISLPSNSVMEGEGIGTTWIRYYGDTWGGGAGQCQHIRQAVGGRPFTYADNGHDWILRDFSIQDTRPNRSDPGYFFTGIDAMGFIGEHFRVERVEFYNISGNGALNIFNSSNGGAGDGSDFYAVDSLFHNDTDGNHYGFAAINFHSGMNNLHIERNRIWGDWRTGSGAVGGAHLPVGKGQYYINNIVDMTDMGPTPVQCIGAGPGQDIHIVGNSCIQSSTQSQQGIYLQGEVSDPTEDVHIAVEIRGNYVGPRHGATSTPGVAIGLTGYNDDDVVIQGNTLYGGQTPIAVRASGGACGTDPGTGTIDISGNTIYRNAGDTSGILAYVGDATCALRAGKLSSVHDNKIIHMQSGSGQTGVFHNSNAYAYLYCDRSKVFGNSCTPFANCVTGEMGSYGSIVSGITVIANGGTAKINSTYYGATTGGGATEYKFLGIYDGGTAAWHYLPVGISIFITATTTDTVTASVINNSGSSVTLANVSDGGIGNIIFIGERR